MLNIDLLWSYLSLSIAIKYIKMSEKKKTEVKSRLHPRNKNKERYDLEALVKAIPELKECLITNKYGKESIDFSKPQSVKLLNRALLHHYYGVENWDFPDENLCPPIPGRADYIYHIADLLAKSNDGVIPMESKVKALDIGTGASLIYPIIGVTEYGWNFIATDVNEQSLLSAEKIKELNPILKDKIECRLQSNEKQLFKGVLEEGEKIDITLCNPPFHATQKEAKEGTRRKVKNLSGKQMENPELNFSGINQELIYDGGELTFIKTMIEESKAFAKNCFWFTTLVSKQSHLKTLFKILEKSGAIYIKKIPMGTGNKSSRIIAWTFLAKEEQQLWTAERWT